MMYSDFVRLISFFTTRDFSSLLIIASFAVATYFVSQKLMSAFVEGWHTAVLTLIFLALAGILITTMQQSQAFTTLMLTIPSFFIGQEVYGRLGRSHG